MKPVSLLLVVFLGLTGLRPAARAQGGPPMITDDPGTPGDGHWEINVALTTEHRDDERLTETPLLDINYGLGDRVQIKYEAAWLRLDDGTDDLDGLSNSLVGVKWRFYDAGEGAWSASMYPQVEFNNPGSHADDDGLVESGTGFELPFQVMRDFGRFEFNADLGYVWHSGGNAWFGGMVFGREIGHGVEVAAELHWDADATLHATALTVNFGARLDLSEQYTLLASAGRELHNGLEPRASFIAYLGLQTEF